MTDDGSNSSSKQQKMNEQERQEDIRKHLNVDFDENEEEQARRLSVDEYNISGGDLANFSAGNDISQNEIS